MPEEKPKNISAMESRYNAEDRIIKSAKTAAWQNGADARRLLQQLEVDQIDLELQNEELRQTKAELEANYNELYDSAPVGYFMLRPHGHIENANLTGASMLGQPRTWLPGRRFASFVAPESLSCFNDFLSRVTAGFTKESCMVTLLKGDDTPVIVFIEATGAGQDSSFRAVVVDITSTEQARIALRESEARLNLALAVSGMGVWECECDSGDIYWSLECNRIFGVSHLSPKLDTMVQLLHPEDALRIRATISQALAGKNEQSVECRIIRPDGELVLIHIRAQVQCDAAGKPQRLFGIAQDISERRRAEQNASPALV